MCYNLSMINKSRLWLGLRIGFCFFGAIAIGVYLGQLVQLPDPITSPTISPTLTMSPTTPVSTLSPINTPSVTSIPNSKVETTLPSSALIAKVPFIEQAPLKNWDAVHEETCEEAAVLTVVHYLEGQRQPAPAEIETELQNLIAWEQKVLGMYEDTTVAETARMLVEYFNYGERVRIVELTKLDDLKREVAAGRPVIVPAAGRLLGNRYFKSPGPIYHMTVVIGYTETEIISNDPGTQHGAGYRYDAAQFWIAIHDFVNRSDEGMASGAKLALVVD